MSPGSVVWPIMRACRSCKLSRAAKSARAFSVYLRYTLNVRGCSCKELATRVRTYSPFLFKKKVSLRNSQRKGAHSYGMHLRVSPEVSARALISIMNIPRKCKAFSGLRQNIVLARYSKPKGLYMNIYSILITNINSKRGD